MLAVLLLGVSAWLCAHRSRSRQRADEEWRQRTLGILREAGSELGAATPPRGMFMPRLSDPGEVYLWANSAWPEDLRRELITTYRRIRREQRRTS